MAEMRTTRPNGEALAAIVAAGIGSVALGLMTVGAEMSEGLKAALNLNAGVGPLSGKTAVGVIAYVVSWAVLHQMWKGRERDFGSTMRIAYVLIALGFLFTFPPFFTLFAAE
jgi:hypothetical protein